MKILLVGLSLSILSFLSLTQDASAKSDFWECTYGNYFFDGNLDEETKVLSFDVCNDHRCPKQTMTKEAKIVDSSAGSGVDTYVYNDALGKEQMRLYYGQGSNLTSVEFMGGQLTGSFQDCQKSSSIK